MDSNRLSMVWRTPQPSSCYPRIRNAHCARFLSIRAQSSGSDERPIWLPGLSPPQHLDGSLAGDFGFDPLELGKDPETLRWYVQAELVHSRFAMAGIAGILVTDLLRTVGGRDLPVWYEAGATEFEFADTRTLFVVQLILMGYAETRRYYDYISPGSQAAQDTFLGFEDALAGLQSGYPGGPFFDPAGLGRDINNARTLKEKELKNGRLAMVAILGVFVQAFFTKTGPIDNLLTHVSDPWHNTIVQTLSHG
ncbi:light-harvesting complex [Selaginella moellendorffii]|uniref:Chlorophyll a-b binding protein, chloroplastic n=1 Tax=Selaginella moellendorffii TaxID=88036 RepID=D8QTU2_SELML|nr:light-harvesting complex [Selaginella moellendorffii]EFJ36706.1 light-harvesting complex [Selaginella moellendorffii]